MLPTFHVYTVFSIVWFAFAPWILSTKGHQPTQYKIRLIFSGLDPTEFPLKIVSKTKRRRKSDSIPQNFALFPHVKDGTFNFLNQKTKNTKKTWEKDARKLILSPIKSGNKNWVQNQTVVRSLTLKSFEKMKSLRSSTRHRTYVRLPKSMTHSWLQSKVSHNHQRNRLKEPHISRQSSCHLSCNRFQR